MKNIKCLYVWVLIFFLFSATGCQKVEQKNPPKATQGVIDLRNWDFEKNGSIKLHGDWQFYNKQLLSPKDFIVPHQFEMFEIGNTNIFFMCDYGTYKLDVNVGKNTGLCLYYIY